MQNKQTIKILITGGAGFIGSSLCEHFISKGYTVVCLDNLATGYKKNIAHLLGNPAFTFIEGDIRNLADCQNAVQGATYVLHEAALGSVPRSIKDPITTNDVNVGGFLNMLTASRDAGVKRFVYAASSSTYGDSEALPKVEDKIGKPLSPYAITKYVNELYADIFSRTYGLETIGLRYFNVFGKRQDPDGAYAAVIPKFVMQLMQHESPVINGDGNYSRDFTYIDNVVQMNELALFTNNINAVNTVYNTAYGERTTLNELIGYLKQYLADYDAAIANVNIVYGVNRAGDIPHSLASVDKAKEYLGYNPQYSISQGLKEAIGWYWENLTPLLQKKMNIAVIGLGYVGLPLAVLLAKKYRVTGFDINATRVNELNAGNDATLEVSDDKLKEVLNNDGSSGLYNTFNAAEIASCNYYIVTVPTPVDKNNRPNLGALISASKIVGNVLKKGDIVIYESTVYPGVTEDECVPVLEQVSGLTFNEDFFAGYSPERINPGDKEHTVDKIIKVTSGSTPEAADKVDALYKSVITAGTHKAPSIKVAEAAKVIENSQRDINIAFVNELAKIFNLLDIDTHAVLEAASSKWNFLPFRPGLVGGHCIGVDPYYLAQKAQEAGYHPEIILAGRRVNDSMGGYVASQLVKLMIKNEVIVNGAKVLMLGITFKENCPDVRNTKIVDVISALKEYGITVDVYDPWANPEEVKREYGVITTNTLPEDKYDAVVLGVSHNQFKNLDIKSLLQAKNVVYDVKGFLKWPGSVRL